MEVSARDGEGDAAEWSGADVEDDAEHDDEARESGETFHFCSGSRLWSSDSSD